MKRTRQVLFSTLVFAFLLAAQAGGAHARPRPDRATSFEANKVFGLGIMLGAPTGLSGKYYLSSTTAIDFGLGAYHRFRHHSAWQLHADFLWHPAVLAEADPFLLALYFGVGGRLLDHDRHEDFDDDDDTHLGVRVPVGLLMDFNRVPVDIFFELALVVDLVAHEDANLVDFDAAVGARYYF